MQFQAGSNKAARRVDSAGNQGFGGTWGIYRKSSGHPPYRMDDADDEIAAAAAKLAYDSDHGRSGRARCGATTRSTRIARPCCGARLAWA